MKTKIIEEITVNGATATLKKLRPGVYSLTATNTHRARFGNKAEITEDKEHFKTYGTLPYSTSPHWA